MLPAFLDDRGFRLLLFGGKGGVGKTTCAAATGLRLAQRFPERSYLLVSTDPAHSLADSLAACEPPRNLQVLEMDSRQSLAAFQAKNGQKLREIASRGTFLDDEDLNRLLELSLPGLDELMAFLDISTWTLEQRYECILVDTAPSGHTLRMLQVPGLLRSWLGALDSMLAKHRCLRQVFGRSSDADELDLFLEQFTGSLRQMEGLLRDLSRCRFVPVLLAEALSVRETIDLVEELERLGLPITDLVVNRLYPENRCPACGEARRSQWQELRAIFREPALSRYSAWGVPLYPEEVRGGRALLAFWDGVAALAETGSPVKPATIELPPEVEMAAEPPSPATRLLLIGGKGGVGKTTLACATAVWLAREAPGTRVLLFSADPAHSLADCLDLPVGPSPTQVCPGLSAMEIDARAEFESLKRLYAEEVERFFSAVSRNFDLTFDREVMERILDLAPPGLDEIMAQARVMDFLARQSYDILVLDSAATGHLVRWLELPALIEQWIAVFFGLFLKYERVFRLPKFSERLVQVSRHLKALKKLLGDPERSQLYVVGIPTQMALEETRDLVAACERMGVHVPSIFLNLVTRPRDCSLCSAIHRQETVVRQEYRDSFPRQRQVVIYRQRAPRGLTRLAELAGALYLPAGKESVSCVS